MAAPQNVSLPPFFTLSDGMQVRLSAIDATTGAAVAGVTVSQVSIDVDPDSNIAQAETPDNGPILFLPGSAA